MTSLYERMAQSDRGARHLASARLRHEVLRKLYLALESSGLTQNRLAEILRIRKSAVSQTLRGDGNLRIKTLAEYLHAMGYELELRLVESGEPRKAALEDRAVELAPIEKTESARGRAVAEGSESPDHAESLHVVGGVDKDLLVEMKIQAVGSERPGYTFEGRIHVVDKQPIPSGFRPVKNAEIV
ncbi:helix-turn-helix domain-containing protein [Streptomyces griseoincarnatus]